MKKLLLALFCVMTMCLFGGCNNIPTNSSSKGNYKLVAQQTFYTVYINDEMNIPDVTLSKDGEEITGKTITVKVSDPDGTEVTVTNDKFVCTKSGNYKITYQYDEAVCIVNVKVENFALQAPITDLSVNSQTGTVSFTELEDATAVYSLYVNNTFKTEVSSGDKINDYLVVGVNEIYIIIDARNGYAESEASNKVSVMKYDAVSDLRLENGKLFFTEVEGRSYALYNSGKYISAATSGMDISEFIYEDSTSIFYVITEAKDNYIASSFSNAVTVVQHKKINDFSIDEMGLLSFSETYGFSYELYLKDGANEAESVKEEVNGQTNISTILDELEAGLYEFYVYAKGVEENCFVSEENETSNIFKIQKLAEPNVPFITDEYAISFEENVNCVYQLILDGKTLGTINSGDDISSKFTKIGESKIQLLCVAQESGYWGYGKGTEITYNVPEFANLLFKGSDSNATMIAGETYTYGDNYSIDGVVLQGIEGSKFTFERDVNLENAENNSFINFQIAGINSQFNLYELVIRLYDKADANNYVTVKLWHGARGHSNTYIVAGIGENVYGYAGNELSNGTGFDGYWEGVALNGQYPSSEAIRSISMQYNCEENAIYYTGTNKAFKIIDLDDDLYNNGIVSERWSGFSSLQVRCEIEFKQADGVSRLIVQKLGEYNFAEAVTQFEKNYPSDKITYAEIHSGQSSATALTVKFNYQTGKNPVAVPNNWPKVPYDIASEWVASVQLPIQATDCIYLRFNLKTAATEGTVVSFKEGECFYYGDYAYKFTDDYSFKYVGGAWIYIYPTAEISYMELLSESDGALRLHVWVDPESKPVPYTSQWLYLTWSVTDENTANAIRRIQLANSWYASGQNAIALYIVPVELTDGLTLTFNVGDWVCINNRNYTFTEKVTAVYSSATGTWTLVEP